ncbi:MAG: hypothetical protein WKF94_15065 [Solirubrobacteraceae bacterium]
MSAARRFAGTLNAPTLVGAACAIAVFVAFLKGWLTSWTPLEGTYARDYITLPHCGLAVREGTNMFTSSLDYPDYGPVGSGWVSHPLLCVTAGTPLSYLSPLTGFKLVNFLYLILHLGIIVGFGRRLIAPYRVRDCAIFVALGLFFPWYVMYHTGQYHALSVLALALVLAGPRRRVGGFVLSAVTKPVLGPAGLVLIFRGHRREALKIVALLLALSLPFALFGYSREVGLNFGGGALKQFLDIGTSQSNQLVPGWDQQVSLALLLDERFQSWDNLRVRQILTGALLLLALVGLRRRPIEVAIAVASLWFLVYYARGHEYHGTLLVPVFAYLWTESRGLYRTPWVALLCAVYALPTTWPLFIHRFDLPGPGPESFAFMEQASSPLFVAFLAHKPVVALLLVLTIAWKELRPRRAEASAVAPEPAFT